MVSDREYSFTFLHLKGMCTHYKHTVINNKLMPYTESTFEIQKDNLKLERNTADRSAVLKTTPSLHNPVSKKSGHPE